MYKYKGDPISATDRALHNEIVKVIEEDLDLWDPFESTEECPCMRYHDKPYCICSDQR